MATETSPPGEANSSNDFDKEKSTEGGAFDADAYKDEEVLNELYVHRGWSMANVGELFDKSEGTIGYWIKKYGIETRDRIKASADTRWKGDRIYIEQGGYTSWKHGEGQYMRLHRLLAVAKYGFEEVKGMDVHHKNEIPWDNRMDNIELMTRSEHSKHHNRSD